MPVKACVFDAYGTLFDVAAAARILAEQPGQSELSLIANSPRLHLREKQAFVRASLASTERQAFHANANDYQEGCSRIQRKSATSEIKRRG